AERMALHRSDDRLAQRPRRHQAAEASTQARVVLERVVPPGVFTTTAADVEADAEAAPGPAQQDHTGRGVLVGAPEHLLEREPHLHRQGVELVGPVERDDADLAVGFVKYKVSGHCDYTLRSRPRRRGPGFEEHSTWPWVPALAGTNGWTCSPISYSSGRVDVERRNPRHALDLNTTAGPASALLRRDHPPVWVVEPQPQEVTLAMLLRPILVFPSRVQHH